ncbi:MAG: vWA domain-containing protein [Polyangiales bacterium]
MKKLLRAAWLAVLAAGCGSGGAGDGSSRIQELPSICGEPGAPAGCGAICTSDSACDSGTYCQDGACIAVCTVEGGQCGGGAECTSSGRCAPVFEPSDGHAAPDGAVCGEIEIRTDRVIPNIMVIVDRSGSMLFDFDGDSFFSGTLPNPAFDGSRWDSVQDALVGADGLLRRLDSIARFGVTFYWKPHEDSPSMSDGDMCASLDGVALTQSLENADAIADLFDANQPNGYTPTAEAIDAITDSLVASAPPEGPTVYLLATDGNPNGCNQDEETIDRDHSLQAVRRAFDLGVETFVLGVSFDDAHLQDLANAGQGVASGATLWTADNVSELQSALEEIVVRNIPCEVSLTDGIIDTSQACDGQVRLSGELLGCNDELRGWRAIDGRTIELRGSACTDWRTGDATLEARFPCYVVVQ